MTENIEFEENEESGESQYVTRDELESMLDTKFESFIDRFTSDTLEGDDGWVDITEEIDEVLGSMSPSEIEKMMERKVQEAIAGLGVKKTARTPVKSAAPVKKVAPKKEVEEAPTVPGKMSFGQRLWGNK
jgi:hypothetical protein